MRAHSAFFAFAWRFAQTYENITSKRLHWHQVCRMCVLLQSCPSGQPAAPFADKYNNKTCAPTHSFLKCCTDLQHWSSLIQPVQIKMRSAPDICKFCGTFNTYDNLLEAINVLLCSVVRSNFIILAFLATDQAIGQRDRYADRFCHNMRCERKFPRKEQNSVGKHVHELLATLPFSKITSVSNNTTYSPHIRGNVQQKFIVCLNNRIATKWS